MAVVAPLVALLSPSVQCVVLVKVLHPVLPPCVRVVIAVWLMSGARFALYLQTGAVSVDVRAWFAVPMTVP